MPPCADLTPSDETGVSDRVLDVADMGRAVPVDWFGGGVIDDTGDV